MKVYVVIKGLYSDQFISSVHSSAERAKESYPGERWIEDKWGIRNDKDFGDALEIKEIEVDGTVQLDRPFL